MTGYELIFAVTVSAFQIILCFFVFTRHLERRLPFFAVYAIILLICSVAIDVVFARFGFQSDVSYYAYWFVSGIVLLARSSVVVELCRKSLRVYPGIWALAWRFLALITILFFIHAAFDAGGQPNRLPIYGLTLERDLDIASITILAVLLLIQNYYGLSLEPLHRKIAVGIFILCAVDVISNTALRNLFTGYLFPWFLNSQASIWPAMRPQIVRVNDWWNTMHFSSSVISMGIWCFALRKPLPEPAESSALLPAELYRDLSPALNLRLRAFNDRLVELLKP